MTDDRQTGVNTGEFLLDFLRSAPMYYWDAAKHKKTQVSDL